MRRSHVALIAGASALALSLTVTTRLAWAADADKGKAVFEECAACHTLDGTAEDDGPTLQGVFGRKAAARDDYRYSAAMTRSGVTWDAESLDKYIADPEGFIPGNRMSFAGIPDKTKRDDLIAYLAVAAK